MVLSSQLQRLGPSSPWRYHKATMPELTFQPRLYQPGSGPWMVDATCQTDPEVKTWHADSGNVQPQEQTGTSPSISRNTSKAPFRSPRAPQHHVVCLHPRPFFPSGPTQHPKRMHRHNVPLREVPRVAGIKDRKRGASRASQGSNCPPGRDSLWVAGQEDDHHTLSYPQPQDHCLENDRRKGGQTCPSLGTTRDYHCARSSHCWVDNPCAADVPSRPEGGPDRIDAGVVTGWPVSFPACRLPHMSRGEDEQDKEVQRDANMCVAGPEDCQRSQALETSAASQQLGRAIGRGEPPDRQPSGHTGKRGGRSSRTQAGMAIPCQETQLSPRTVDEVLMHIQESRAIMMGSTQGSTAGGSPPHALTECFSPDDNHSVALQPTSPYGSDTHVKVSPGRNGSSTCSTTENGHGHPPDNLHGLFPQVSDALPPAGPHLLSLEHLLNQVDLQIAAWLPDGKISSEMGTILE